MSSFIRAPLWVFWRFFWGIPLFLLLVLVALFMLVQRGPAETQEFVDRL